LTLLIVLVEAYLAGVLSRDFRTQFYYFGLIALLIINTIGIYQYKIKSTVEDYITKDTEMLKVKWLSFLFISFITPMVVFFFNTQPNYVILRFHYSLIVIVMLVLALVGILVTHIIIRPTKADLNSTVMKQREPMILISTAILFASAIMNLRDVWI